MITVVRTASRARHRRRPPHRHSWGTGAGTSTPGPDPRCWPHRDHHTLKLIVELDSLHDRIFDTENPSPCPGVAHAVFPYLSRPDLRQAGTLRGQRRAPLCRPQTSHRSVNRANLLHGYRPCVRPASRRPSTTDQTPLNHSYQQDERFYRTLRREVIDEASASTTIVAARIPLGHGCTLTTPFDRTKPWTWPSPRVCSAHEPTTILETTLTSVTLPLSPVTPHHRRDLEPSICERSRSAIEHDARVPPAVLASCDWYNDRNCSG